MKLDLKFSYKTTDDFDHVIWQPKLILFVLVGLVIFDLVILYSDNLSADNVVVEMYVSIEVLKLDLN